MFWTSTGKNVVFEAAGLKIFGTKSPPPWNPTLPTSGTVPKKNSQHSLNVTVIFASGAKYLVRS
jgi:hypothetical protein